MTPRAEALKVWNSKQQAWKPVKRYNQLTPAERLEVDDLTHRIEHRIKALLTPLHHAPYAHHAL